MHFLFFNSSLGQFSDLQVGAMLDDRKLSARALFDANSQRQILTGVRVEVGQSVCHTLPFHVFVSPHNTDTDRQIDWLFLLPYSFCISVCLINRTQQTTSDQSVSPLTSKSMTQIVVQCSMKAGQPHLSNLWVQCVYSLYSSYIREDH